MLQASPRIRITAIGLEEHLLHKNRVIKMNPAGRDSLRMNLASWDSFLIMDILE
jgi:hypothetical protein